MKDYYEWTISFWRRIPQSKPIRTEKRDFVLHKEKTMKINPGNLIAEEHSTVQEEQLGRDF